jgi:hypothetical protein
LDDRPADETEDLADELSDEALDRSERPFSCLSVASTRSPDNR